MKTSTKSLSLVKGLTLALMIFGTLAAAKAEDATHVIDSRYKNLFVFKADRKFKDAEVKIFYSNGDLIASQKLTKRKMTINFCDVKYGTYTIVLLKGNKSEIFEYIKK